jgi:ribose/xylose/arabinose/galactoside ABC-type transport system permease subunit
MKKISIVDILPVMIMAILIVIFAVLSGGNILSGYNISSLMMQIVPILVGSLGVIFVIAIGGTDISVGANAAFCATIGGLVANETGVSALFIPITVILSTLVGVVIGSIVQKFKVGSFILTLAVLMAEKGMLNYLYATVQVKTPEGMDFLATPAFAVVLIVVSVVVIFIIFEKSSFGFYAKCMGENERTVRCVGVNTAKIRIICFAISGLFAGIVGFTQLARAGGSSNALCNMLEMRVQMAIFLGGILTTGGFSAKLYKVIIGSITIAVIENGLTVIGASSYISEATEGLLLVAILIITIFANRAADKKADRDSIAQLEAE